MFNKLVGNENVKQTLRRLIRNGRIPNSLLFAGDEGVGKRQFAIELAKAFVCADPYDHEACGTCAACRRADVFVFPTSEKGDDYEQVFFSGHPDIGIVIPFGRNVRVDAIRALEREANFRPFEAPARFLIIDDAEKMNDASANALLKTLEEPSTTTHIFVVTSRPDSLLSTIRSRCQTLRFAPVGVEEIEQFLIRDRACTHDEARLAAHLSQGSVGRALTINVEQFRRQREKMLSIVLNLIETGDRAALLRASETMNDAKNRTAFEENLDILQSLLHDVWLVAASGYTDKISNSDLVEQLTSLAQSAGQSDLAGWMNEIDIVRENLVVNINRRIAADALFVKMAGA
jgi:DNA polymerase III subunit delta'